jgi:hypothetical protein
MQTRIYAGGVGVFPYSLCGLDINQRVQAFTTTGGTGTSKVFNTTAKFLYPPTIMYHYANETKADGAVVTNNVLYEQFPSANLTYSCNITTSAGFTQYKPVFLEAKMNEDGTWSPTSTGLTQTLTSGNYYILIGCMYNTSIYQLCTFAHKPMFYCDGGHLVGVDNTDSQLTWGYCANPYNDSDKSVTLPGFVHKTNALIFIVFHHHANVTSPFTLNINGTGAANVSISNNEELAEIEDVGIYWGLFRETVISDTNRFFDLIDCNLHGFNNPVAGGNAITNLVYTGGQGYYRNSFGAIDTNGNIHCFNTSGSDTTRFLWPPKLFVIDYMYGGSANPNLKDVKVYNSRVVYTDNEFAIDKGIWHKIIINSDGTWSFDNNSLGLIQDLSETGYYIFVGVPIKTGLGSYYFFQSDVIVYYDATTDTTTPVKYLIKTEADNIYVTQANGTITTKLTVGTGSGTGQQSNGLKFWTKAGPNRVLGMYWSYGDTWGTNPAQISYSNQYNGTTPGDKGALMLLPYQAQGTVDDGSKGLWIVKDHAYIDGVELSKVTHNHDETYVPLTGSANMSGIFQANGNGSAFAVVNTDSTRRIGLHIGTGGTNRGLWDWGGSSYPDGANTWVFRVDAENHVGLLATLLESETANNGMPIPVLAGTPGTETKNIYNSDGFRINLQSGTTSTTGKAELVLGNAKGSTTEGNKQGQLSIYSTSTSYHRIQAASTSTAKTWTLPAIPGITVNGSANHTNVFAANRYSIIYDDTSHTSTPWYKFAEITVTTTNEDHIITFLVSTGFNTTVQHVPDLTGILTAHVRTNGSKIHSIMELKWNLACGEIDPAEYVMVYTDTANTSCKVELWCNMPKQYDSRIFQVLKEHKRREVGTYWTLVRNDGRSRAANHTTGTGTVTSSLCTIKNPIA